MARFDGKTNKQKATRVMVNELSGVDIPAHVGANTSIFKIKSTEQDIDKKFSLVSITNGHQHLIDLDHFAFENKGGRLNWEEDHSHPFEITSDGNIIIGVAHGHTHKISMTAEEILFKNSEDNPSKENPVDKNTDNSIAGGKGDKSNNGGNTMPHEKQIADLTASVDTLKVDLVKAQKFGLLTDISKAFYIGLDEKQQAIFLEKSADDQNADIEASQSDDPVVYKAADGTEIRKSAGDLAISSVKRADALEKRLNKQIEKTENAEISKRADEELSHLPGDDEARVAVLKALDGIKDEDVRKNALAMVKANNTSMSTAFVNVGVTKAEIANAGDELDKLAKKHAADNDVDFAKAYTHVLSTKQGEDLYALTIEH